MRYRTCEACKVMDWRTISPNVYVCDACKTIHWRVPANHPTPRINEANAAVNKFQLENPDWELEG